MLAKKNFPLLLSPNLWRAVLSSLESPVLRLLGLVCPVRPIKSGFVRWAETHPLPVPFPLAVKRCLVWVCRGGLSSGGEGRHEAWVQVRPSGRVDSPWSCMGAGEGAIID